MTDQPDKPDKPIHALIIDAGPLITSTSTTSLLSRAQKVYTTPSVIAEIRDTATRSCLETAWFPFLQQRTPAAVSVRTVSEFAKKTGDFVALSVTDLQLLALTYELEVEGNKGDWRLRRVPGQKGINGPVPKKERVKGEVKSEKGGVEGGLRSEKDEGKSGKKNGMKEEKEGEGEKTEKKNGKQKYMMKQGNDEDKGEVKKGVRWGGEKKDGMEGEKVGVGVGGMKDEEWGWNKVRRRRRERGSAKRETNREVKKEGEVKAEVEKDEKGEDVKEEDVKEEVKQEVTGLKETINGNTKEVKEESKKGAKEEIREDATKERIQKQPQEQVMGEVKVPTAKETLKAEFNAEGTAESPEQPPTPASTIKKEPIQDITPEEVREEDEQPEESSSDNCDNEGWITAENIRDHKAKDTHTPTHPSTSPKIFWPMAAALATTDFAMQNVLLQMNLHLVSPNDLQRICMVKTWVLRCHACFRVCRDMNKQFCPSCGGATLLRTSCSTDSQGVFRVHLKKIQWSNRGNVYSIQKTQHGSASGKGVKKNLILREDQVEYQREVRQMERQKERDLLDPDYLPRILTGERNMIGARPKIGYGRVNPNERNGGRSKR